MNRNKLLLLALLVGVLLMGAFGYLEPLRSVLDSPQLNIRLRGESISPWEILKTILVIVAFFWLALALSAGVERYFKKKPGTKNSNRVLLTLLFQVLLFTAFFFLSLDILGVDLTTFAILGGAIGIGVGFGIQKIKGELTAIPTKLGMEIYDLGIEYYARNKIEARFESMRNNGTL